MNIAVVDLGFGDAGKGSIVDFLARTRRVDRVVRFNGGAQAGHNVVTPDGRHHTFSQFGAGHFAGVPTWLGPDFLLHPHAMAVEASHLPGDPWPAVSVHPEAKLISPYHQAVNRHRETQVQHGSCGVGIGTCVEQDLLHPELTLRAKDLTDAPTLRRRLEQQREALRDPAIPIFEDAGLIERVVQIWGDIGTRLRLEVPVLQDHVVFEGAQGVLLDQWWGFHPHTTWSDCTFAGAEAVCDGAIYRLGVLRSYGVRHGAGPFPGEGLLTLPELHNRHSPWQRDVRTGAFDHVLYQYATEVCPIDGLALTCLDRVQIGPVVIAHSQPVIPGEREDLVHRERMTQQLFDTEVQVETQDLLDLAPVLQSWGPGAGDKRVVEALEEV